RDDMLPSAPGTADSAASFNSSRRFKLTLLIKGGHTRCDRLPNRAHALQDARRRLILFIMINRMNMMLELIKIGVNQAKFRTRAATDHRR
ncbi:hypothetical protein, partial [Burkholderia sp.]|uniref:hypothetical protein n=1 Tax=Burkholderia sp. TaxID=36773 RepID=UPI00258EE3DB